MGLKVSNYTPENTVVRCTAKTTYKLVIEASDLQYVFNVDSITRRFSEDLLQHHQLMFCHVGAEKDKAHWKLRQVFKTISTGNDLSQSVQFSL